MPKPGGPADKAGNNYEAEWTVRCMLDILIGHATNIVLEPVGPEGKGVEFSLHEADGTLQYHQVKRQNPLGKWSISALSGVLVNFRNKLHSGDSLCVFVSTQQAFELENLRELIDRCETFADYQTLALDTQGRRDAFEALQSTIDYPGAQTFSFLKHVDVRSIDERTLHNINVLLFEIVLSEGNAQSAVAVLDKWSRTALHTSLSRDDIVRHLHEHGFELRRNVPTLPMRVVSILESIPSLPEPLVSRRNIIDGIKAEFLSGTRGIIVEGPDGIGKSTLLVEFVRTQPNDCAWFTFEADVTCDIHVFLREICQQIEFALGTGVTVPHADFDSLKGRFANLCRDLKRRYRRLQRNYFIVVDGLENVAPADHERLTKVLDIRQDGVFVLGSCLPGSIPGLGFTTLPLLTLSPAEIHDYLERIGVKAAIGREKIIQNCGGMPGYLDQIRREILQDIPLESVLADLPSTFGQLLTRDWNRMKQTETALWCLGIVAYGPQAYTVQELATMVGANGDELREQLTRNSFISLAERHLRPTTPAHRTFLREHLKDSKDRIINKLIDYYKESKSFDSSVRYLPDLYFEKRDYSSLKELITGDYLVDVLQKTRELPLVQRHLHYLVESAFENQDWPSLSKYSLNSTILWSYAERSPQKVEIEALLAIGEYRQSIDRAFSAPIPEDRLELLVVVAKYLRKQASPLASGVIEEIKTLCEQVSVTRESISRVIDISADLFAVNPKLAIDLLRSSGGGELTGASMDGLLAALALRTKDESGESFGAIPSEVADPRLRDMLRASDPAVEQLSAQSVIMEANEIGNVTAKLFLFRSWCKTHRKSPDTSLVLEQALDILLAQGSSALQYTHPMIYLRELSQALPGVDVELLPALLRKFDALKGTTIRRPVEELIRLELELARAERRFSPSDAATRLKHALDDISSFDLDVQCYCYAKMLHFSATEGPGFLPVASDHLRDGLNDAFLKLLTRSSSHSEVTKRTIGAVAQFDAIWALALAEELNTRERRDSAYKNIVVTHLRKREVIVSLDCLEEAIALAETGDARGEIVAEALRTLRVHKDVRLSSEKLATLLDCCHLIGNSVACCFSLASLFSLAYKSEYVELADKAYQTLLSTWQQIDADWDRFSAGYHLTRIIAECSQKEARQFFEKVESLTTVPNLYDGKIAELYVNCARLAIRYMSDLSKSPRNLEKVEHFLEVYIRRLPSKVMQCRLISDLALRIRESYATAFDLIVGRDLKPLVEGLRQSNPWYHDKAIAFAAPCLYEYSEEQFRAHLRELDDDAREAAVRATIAWLLSGRSPLSDGQKTRDRNWKIRSVKIGEKLVELLGELTTDTQFYSGVRSVTLGLLRSPHGQGKEALCLPEEGTLSLVLGVQPLLERLPDKNNIKHDGYKVAIWGLLHRLRNGSRYRYRTMGEWTTVVPELPAIEQQAKAVPNVADRFTVLCWLGSDLRFANPTQAAQLLHDAEELVSERATVYERAMGLCILVEAWRDLAEAQGRVAEDARRLIVGEAKRTLEGLDSERQRDEIAGQLLQLTYSIDEPLTQLILDAVSNPILKETLQGQRLQQEILKEPRRIVRLRESLTGKDLAGASELIFEKLCSSLPLTLTDTDLGHFLRMSSQEPFSIAFPVHNMAIQNDLITKEPREGAACEDKYQGVLDSIEFLILMGAAVETTGRMPSYSTPDNLRLEGTTSYESARELVVQRLSEWSIERLYIIDNDFSYRDIATIRCLLDKGVRVCIFSSWQAQGLECGSKYLGRFFSETWHEIAAGTGAEGEISIASTEVGRSPFDRTYYITDRLTGYEIVREIDGAPVVRRLTQEEADEAVNAATQTMERRQSVIDDYRVIYRREDL